MSLPKLAAGVLTGFLAFAAGLGMLEGISRGDALGETFQRGLIAILYALLSIFLFSTLHNRRGTSVWSRPVGPNSGISKLLAQVTELRQRSR